MKEDLQIVELKTSPILLFKHVKFKDNSLSGINSSINQIMSNYFGGMNTSMGPGNIFESLINNMANIQSDLNSTQNEIDNDNDSDDGVDIEDDDENEVQVNNNQSVTIKVLIL